ncbi:hypothetical protein MMC22_003076 [Lobaria immixta]|nr:hypothetical protein [Lobaria immixta]
MRLLALAPQLSESYYPGRLLLLPAYRSLLAAYQTNAKKDYTHKHRGSYQRTIDDISANSSQQNDEGLLHSLQIATELLQAKEDSEPLEKGWHEDFIRRHRSSGTMSGPPDGPVRIPEARIPEARIWKANLTL